MAVVNVPREQYDAARSFKQALEKKIGPSDSGIGGMECITIKAHHRIVGGKRFEVKEYQRCFEKAPAKETKEARKVFSLENIIEEKKGEVIVPEDVQPVPEEAKADPQPEKAEVNIAPLFDTQITTDAEAQAIVDSELYQDYISKTSKVAEAFGLTVEERADSIGGFGGIAEASTVWTVSGDFEDVKNFAAVTGALTPEVQEATIAARIVEKGSPDHNADSFSFVVEDRDAAIQAAKNTGYDDKGYTLNGNEFTVLNIHAFEDSNFKENTINLLSEYEKISGEKIPTEKISRDFLQSEYIDHSSRQEIIRGLGESQGEQGSSGQELSVFLREADERNKRFGELKAAGVRPLVTSDFTVSDGISEIPLPPNPVESQEIVSSQSPYRKDLSKQSKSLMPDAPIAGLKDDIQRSIGAPNKTIKAYKLLDVNKDGVPVALFVDKGVEIPVGTWMEANDPYHYRDDNGSWYVPVKKGGSYRPLPDDNRLKEEMVEKGIINSTATKGVNVLAYRAGYHSGLMPHADHLKKQDGTYGDRVWAEVEVSADTNWQEAANSTKTGDVKRLPTNGSYLFKTNSNMVGEWIISDKLKINKILSDSEVNNILAGGNCVTVKTFTREDGVTVKEHTRCYPNGGNPTKEEAPNGFTKIEPITSNPESLESPQFQLSTQDGDPDIEDVQKITDRINSLDTKRIVEAGFLERAISEGVVIKPKGKVTRAGAGDKVDGVTFIDINDEKYSQMPYISTISDHLRTGEVVNPETGTVIGNLHGGVLYPYSKDDKGKHGWAWTTEGKANTSFNDAMKVYEDNKDYFHKAWESGLIPEGNIPMAVVKMGEGGMRSNEAVFRVLRDNMASLPEANKAKAKQLLEEWHINEIARVEAGEITGGTAKIKKLDSALKFVQSKDKLEDVVGDIDSLIISHRGSIMDRLTVGDIKKPTGKVSLNKKSPDTLKALMEGLPESEVSKIHLRRIGETLTEPLTKDVPAGHVIALTGLKVAEKGDGSWSAIEPEFEGSNHPNYPVSLKGEAIGVLEKTVHMAKMSPAAYASALEQSIRDSKSSPITALQRGIPTSALAGKIFQGNKIDFEDSDVKRLVGWLGIANPNVRFGQTTDQWQEVIDNELTQLNTTTAGEVYGATLGDQIYINPEKPNLNTPIHEMGHVWLNHIKHFNNGLYEQGMGLIDNSIKEFKAAKAIYGDTVRAKEEALATLIGNKGETIADAAKKSKFDNWLQGVWSYVHDTFLGSVNATKAQIKKITGREFKTSELTTDQVQNLTIEDFINVSMFDILGGSKKDNLVLFTKKTPDLQVKVTIKSITDGSKYAGRSLPDILKSEEGRKWWAQHGVAYRSQNS
jgi:hypothetical protein